MSERDRRGRRIAPGGDAPDQEHATEDHGVLGMLVGRFGAAGAQRVIQRRLAQRRAREAQESRQQLQSAADKGISGAAGPLPHLEPIQRSFGKHDVSHVKAHSDGAAAEGAAAMGAEAFATADHVAFARAPSLHTAAHEAAHVVQQRGGVQLKGGVGQEGDAYEQHADDVADRVVAGQSAEPLLDTYSDGRANGKGAQAIQRMTEPKSDDDGYDTTEEKDVDDTEARVKVASIDMEATEAKNKIVWSPIGIDLLDKLGAHCPRAADLIQKSSAAMSLVKSAQSDGVKFGGLDGHAYYSSSEHAVYIKDSRVKNDISDPQSTVAELLFELHNAKQGAELKAVMSETDAKKFAREKIRIELMSQIGMGKTWQEMNEESKPRWGSPGTKKQFFAEKAEKAKGESIEQMVEEFANERSWIHEKLTIEDMYMLQCDESLLKEICEKRGIDPAELSTK